MPLSCACGSSRYRPDRDTVRAFGAGSEQSRIRGRAGCVKSRRYCRARCAGRSRRAGRAIGRVPRFAPDQHTQCRAAARAQSGAAAA